LGQIVEKQGVFYSLQLKRTFAPLIFPKGAPSFFFFFEDLNKEMNSTLDKSLNG